MLDKDTLRTGIYWQIVRLLETKAYLTLPDLAEEVSGNTTVALNEMIISGYLVMVSKNSVYNPREHVIATTEADLFEACGAYAVNLLQAQTVANKKMIFPTKKLVGQFSKILQIHALAGKAVEVSDLVSRGGKSWAKAAKDLLDDAPLGYVLRKDTNELNWYMQQPERYLLLLWGNGYSLEQQANRKTLEGRHYGENVQMGQYYGDFGVRVKIWHDNGEITDDLTELMEDAESIYQNVVLSDEDLCDIETEHCIQDIKNNLEAWSANLKVADPKIEDWQALAVRVYHKCRDNEAEIVEGTFDSDDISQAIYDLCLWYGDDPENDLIERHEEQNTAKLILFNAQHRIILFRLTLQDIHDFDFGHKPAYAGDWLLVIDGYTTVHKTAEAAIEGLRVWSWKWGYLPLNYVYLNDDNKRVYSAYNTDNRMSEMLDTIEKMLAEEIED